LETKLHFCIHRLTDPVSMAGGLLVMKVYFISGLGADKRVFKNILLPEGYEAVYLDWINPMTYESLAEYSRRLALSIDDSESFALIGLSMGGMMASEICKVRHPVITIIISGIPVSSHFPFFLRWAGRLGIHRLIPARILKSASLVKSLFARESEANRRIIQQMVSEMDKNFIDWAISAIARWKNEIFPSSYIHIHGTRDKLLPMRYTKPTDLIDKAGHLMILNRAREINQILEKTLFSLS
jgi:pimeloyl-ACP methyl ester carboxylesterase